MRSHPQMSESRGKAASDRPKRDDSSIDHKTNTASIVCKFKVDIAYRIDSYDSHERIGHGKLLIMNDWVNVSFLLCGSIKEQENISRNLISIQHPSIVKVFLPLESVRLGGEQLHPIAIERVSSSFNAFVDREKESMWKDVNLNITFRQIVRDMIDGMTYIHGKDKLHGSKTRGITYIHGNDKVHKKKTEGITYIHGKDKVHGRKTEGITAMDLVMVGDKVKFAFVYADNKMARPLEDFTELKRLDETDLMKLFRIILHNLNKNPEWEHFMIQNFVDKLRFHPMLLDTNKKFLLPYNTRMFLVDVSSIQERFNNLTTPGVKELETKSWSRNISQDKYLDIYNYGNYNPRCASSRYQYIRNVCAHYLHDERFSPEIVVFELNQMFPSYLCDIYEVFDKHYLAMCCE